MVCRSAFVEQELPPVLAANPHRATQTGAVALARVIRQQDRVRSEPHRMHPAGRALLVRGGDGRGYRCKISGSPRMSELGEPSGGQPVAAGLPDGVAAALCSSSGVMRDGHAGEELPVRAQLRPLWDTASSSGSCPSPVSSATRSRSPDSSAALARSSARASRSSASSAAVTPPRPGWRSPRQTARSAPVTFTLAGGRFSEGRCDTARVARRAWLAAAMSLGSDDGLLCSAAA